MQNAIVVENISKTYPGVKAVDDLSFAVTRGEIFGLLGPNGAGKSTTLGVIEGLQRPDSGRVVVLGRDVARENVAVKRRIGVQLQSTSLVPELTALEQVQLFCRLYGQPAGRASALALLDMVNLREKAHTKPDKMSGGQQQRLALALALVNDPDILFLDEPTAGLDPQSRQSLWQMVRDLREQGRTIVLTTHYMEEAEALCDRVGIIDHGRLLALDAPGALINELAGLPAITTSAPLPQDALSGLAGVAAVDQDGSRTRLQTRDVAATNNALFELAGRLGLSLRDVQIQPPTLEDVFLNLTGRTIRDA